MSDDHPTSTRTKHLELLVEQRLVGLGVNGLRVLVLKEGVILRGQTSTYYAKQVAQQAAMDATALPILANEIEVLSGTTPRRTPH